MKTAGGIKGKAMKKQVKIMIVTVLGFLLLAVMIGAVIQWKEGPDSLAVLGFIRDNPQKASLTLIKDGQSMVQYNADRKMPLASVAKIIIAIEYANQAAENKIAPKQMVSLEEINRYYIPKLDGGAQPQWEEYMKAEKMIINKAVPLEEVVKGMIDFSSNANMEYLIELLGLDRINRNIEKLGLKSHEQLYPFYACLLIPARLMKEYGNLPEDEKIKRAKSELRTMPREEFRNLALKEHERLSQDEDGSYLKSLQVEQWYDKEFDKINSDRMVTATTREYGEILSKINSSGYFSKETETYLRNVMEGQMIRKANRKLFKHLGFKGGSTNYILNSTMYVLDRRDQSVEIALFTNDLTDRELKILSKNMNAFLYEAVTEKEFQQKLEGILK